MLLIWLDLLLFYSSLFTLCFLLSVFLLSFPSFGLFFSISFKFSLCLQLYLCPFWGWGAPFPVTVRILSFTTVQLFLVSSVASAAIVLTSHTFRVTVFVWIGHLPFVEIKRRKEYRYLYLPTYSTFPSSRNFSLWFRVSILHSSILKNCPFVQNLIEVNSSRFYLTMFFVLTFFMKDVFVGYRF